MGNDTPRAEHAAAHRVPIRDLVAYYLRLAAVLFATRDVALPPTPSPTRTRARQPAAVAALALTAVATVVLSVDPQPLLHVADLASR